jgi:hypothetical protein
VQSLFGGCGNLDELRYAIGVAAVYPVQLSAVEMIRQYRLRTAASAPAPTPTNVRDFPR